MLASIHIYKTNINSFEQILKMDSILSNHSKINKWTIDIDDCDKVLRIESTHSEINDIILSLKPFYIYCETLN